MGEPIQLILTPIHPDVERVKGVVIVTDILMKIKPDLDVVHIPLYNLNTHGQPYITLSDCTSKDHIKVILLAEANGQTPNIVYQEVLNEIVNGTLSSNLV